MSPLAHAPLKHRGVWHAQGPDPAGAVPCCAGHSTQTGRAVRMRPSDLTGNKTRHREDLGTADEGAQGKGPLPQEPSCRVELQRAAGIALQPPPGRLGCAFSRQQRGTSSGDVPTRNIKQSPETRSLLLYQGSKVHCPASQTPALKTQGWTPGPCHCSPKAPGLRLLTHTGAVLHFQRTHNGNSVLLYSRKAPTGHAKGSRLLNEVLLHTRTADGPIHT